MPSYKGGWTFNLADDVTGTNPLPIGKVTDLSGLGQENPLIDVTCHESAAREYIAGLADGSEITITCNLVLDDAQQQTMKDNVDAGLNGFFFFRTHDGADVTGDNFLTIGFEGTYLKWEIGPSFEDKNTVEFGVKISGAITRVYGVNP